MAGDFSGDSQQDLAAIVSNPADGTYSLAVLLGKGDGNFEPPVLTLITFDSTDRIYAADVNQDGKVDALVFHSGSFDVFISQGDGTFASPVNFVDSMDGAQAPAGVALADLNGDGHLDIAIATGPAGSVSTVLGNGDGTFQLARGDWVPGQFSNAVLADVNGDGRLDVVTSSEVFLASPTGGFQPSISLGGTTACAEMDGVVAAADVSNDGVLDIIVAGCQSNTITIYVGNGDGSFQPGAAQWAGFYPLAITVADVNGDTIPDILVSNAYPSDITVFLGKWDGTFQTPEVGYALGGALAGRPVAADFNGDKITDIIAPQFVMDFESGLTYLQGLGDGSFAAAPDYYEPDLGGGSHTVGIASADFNNDGSPDFVLGNVAIESSIGVTVFINSGGTLKPGVNYTASGSLAFVATGDFNGDGNQDILASDAGSGDVDLLLGNGDATFLKPATFPGAQGSGAGIVAGDFNHDGKPDAALVGSPSSVFILLNDGKGGFQPPVSYPITSDGWEIATADLNGDKNLDLVITQGNSNLVSILLGVGDGTFSSVKDFDLGSNFPAGVAVGDLNSDGNPDLAVAIGDDTRMGIAVALGYGDGSFQPAILYSASAQKTGDLESFPSEISMVDQNQDGRVDLVYTNLGFGTVGVLYGNGDGTFSAPVEFPAGISVYGLAVTDINGDGALDAIIGNEGFPGITVLLNTGGSKISLVSSANPSSYGQPVMLTATVTMAVRGVTTLPTGGVTFMDSGNALGSASLDGAGKASLVLPLLSAGDHALSAAYSGDASFLPSASNSLIQTVTSAGADYTLSATPTSASIQAGHPAVFDITATAMNGFSGTVDFTCGAMPQGVTCEFTPSSVNVSDGQPSSVQLTASVLADALASAANRGPNRGLPLWFSFSAGLFGWVLIEGLDAKKRRRRVLIVTALALLASLSLTACATGPASSVPAAKGASQTIQVTATSNAGGNTKSHQINISIIIQR